MYSTVWSYISSIPYLKLNPSLISFSEEMINLGLDGKSPKLQSQMTQQCYVPNKSQWLCLKQNACQLLTPITFLFFFSFSFVLGGQFPNSNRGSRLLCKGCLTNWDNPLWNAHPSFFQVLCSFSKWWCLTLSL